MQSMTGYGSGSASHALGTLEVNIRTVNSRFLEISLHDSKIPAAVSQTVYQVAKIHSRLPVAMEFWLVCLGILAYSCQNTSRNSGV